MSYRRSFAALAGAVALAGCAGDSRTVPISASAAEPGVQVAAAPPALGTGVFAPEPVRPGAPTGTFVGQKVQQLRGDLAGLQTAIGAHNAQLQAIRSQMVQDAQAYYTTIAAINARLQAGTTPGNPSLLRGWNQAQAQLNQIDGRIAQLNDLGNRVATDAALAGYLLEAIRAAYEIPGAVDEDHHQLRILQDEVSSTKVLTDRLLDEINADVARQTNYIAGERQGLTVLAGAIKRGELHGVAASAGYAPAAAAPAATAGRPLVIIRFDQPNVAYEQPLYTAVSQALDRRPAASFEVVAVSPGAASTGARRNAERVLSTLADMGLPRDRVRLSTASGAAGADEVHIYVR